MQASDELPFLQAALPAIAEVAEKPDQLGSVFAILDAGHHSPLAFEAREKLLKNPDIAAMAREPYWGEWPSIARLAKMPDGSLGSCLAARLINDGVGELPKPENIDALSDAHQYIQLRARASHDLWHLVMDLPTSLAGEVAIVAIASRQLRFPSSALVLAAQLLSRSHLEDQKPDLAEAIAYGLKLGGICAPLLAQRWEEGWERPLSDWRDDLNITAELQNSPFNRSGLAD